MRLTHGIKSILAAALFFACIASAEDWVWAKNHPVNSPLPQFTAIDTRGNTKGIEQLSGKNGTLLLFNRSTEW
jgi:hypothetical protein